VPAAAVQREGGNAYVWVVSDGRVERRAVTVGAENDGNIEVRAGVANGDELVSPVVQGLEDGGKVKLKAS
jgi:multidrug efflux pump subunit AcrA (membrane-fusion protein)